MSGEAAARNGRGIGGRWGVASDGPLPDEQGTKPSTGAVRPVENGAARPLPTLVSSSPGDGIAAEMVVASDPRSVLDALLSAAAELIGQAIELHRGLDAVSGDTVADEEGDPSLAGLVADYERRLIEAALQRTHGNRAQAARLLRTTERILGYRVQRYGIDCEAFRG